MILACLMKCINEDKYNTKSCLLFLFFLVFVEFDQDNIYELYLQNFHIESVHPPNISIEDEVVHILPVLAMLLD